MLRSVLILLALLIVLPSPALGQGDPAAGRTQAQRVDPSPPEEVADEFQRGFQSMAWKGLAQRIHPEALAYVRLAVEIIIEADTTDWVIENLGGGADDVATWKARAHDRVFVDLMEWLQANSQGLISSLVSRRSEVLGIVLEGEDTAHVVYRITGLVDGAEPAVLTMTLASTERGWKVLDAPEFRTLHTAVRGLPIPKE